VLSQGVAALRTAGIILTAEMSWLKKIMFQTKRNRTIKSM
jgi:hypothetical protein